jgi:fructoselysine transporter
VGKISMLLWIGVFGTIAWLIFAGATHFHPALAFTYPAGAWHLNWLFFAALGSATVQTIYTYWGYYNVCFLGGEVKDPQRNIPRTIFISIIVVALLYMAMQTSVLGVIPWQEAQHSQYIVSAFFQRIYGAHAAQFATVLILWIAFASLFSLTLGYSRIPYAAALDGNFFSVFGRVHPKKHFPHVSLLALCGVAFVFSLLFRLETVIAAIAAMRILVQFVGQAVGAILLRRKWPSERLPFKMWLYPIPAGIAIILWLALFVATGWRMLFGVIAILAGVLVFLVRAKGLKQWPFAEAT